jgi:hypothetical protein
MMENAKERKREGSDERINTEKRRHGEGVMEVMKVRG